MIIDTETPDYVTWQEVFQSHGTELDRALWERFIGGGVGYFDVYEHLEGLIEAKVDRDAIRTQRRKRYMEMIRANPLLPGVFDYVQDAGRMGLKLAIASSSSRNWVEGHLIQRGLLGYFDCIRSADDVSVVKPDPELYVTAARELGTQPENALVIEDSLNGVRAAKRAGMFCVFVPNPMTAAMFVDNADMRLESLAEMTLEQLLKRVDGDMQSSHLDR